ncbi:MAG: cell division protein FtsX [Chitinophagaceae bacterium]|jgi:cell division transport system permease protein
MATEGRSSIKNSRPNYIYSIIGVALVLLITGLMGWLILNTRSIEKAMKEDVRISIYLRTLNKDTVEQIRQYVASQNFALNVEYVDKEKAKQIWNKENNEDWATILETNPLPESIDFNVKETHVNQDSLSRLKDKIQIAFANQITEVNYPPVLITNMDKVVRKTEIALLVFSIILAVLVIFIIDNTIKLAMFSNRFLIKTMQMVGATRGFILKPMSLQAVLYGFISALIAIAILFGIMKIAENAIPDFKKIHNMQLNLLLFGGIIILGVLITFLSTFRSVRKYLKMKLDDLY